MEGDWGAVAIFRPGAYLVEVCEQMCTCPTRAPQDSCLASGRREEQPLIRASAPSIQLSLVCRAYYALIGPIPSLPSTSCPRIRHLQLLLQETDRMPLLV